MYQVVAKIISDSAMNALSESDVDAFGRSAFNRYYYSAYLVVRDLLGHFDPAWRKQGHANVPELLNEPAKKIFIKAAKKARSAMPHAQIQKSLDKGMDGLKEIARLLTEAYSIRIIADYIPETKAIRTPGKISLGPSNLNSAAYWPVHARIMSSAVMSAGRELGIF